jgi:hypothetical protein
MRLPAVAGVIRRRLLVNYRVDPEVIARHLPPPFLPKLHAGHAIAGICLIRLEQIRPRGLPRGLGVSSENAAHRVAVRWTDETGEREGVFVPRRDSSSLLNQLAGGRLFPGEHNAARFDVTESGGAISLAMTANDGGASVRVDARVADALPPGSVFASVGDASAFFEPGSLGYSASRRSDRLHGVVLRTKTWRVEPLAVERVFSSWFADPSRFPEGSVAFDHGLLMRDIEHEWEGTEDLYVDAPAGSEAPGAET